MTDISSPLTASPEDPTRLRMVPTSNAYRMAGAALLVGITGLIILFWPTVASALQLWDTSSSYTHGYLIAPVAAYLIWTEREQWRGTPVRPSLLGLVVVGLFAGAWMLADLLGINEGRHLAFVGMLQGLFVGVLGLAMYWRLFFPLSYLWLMVPAGEFLIGPLQTIAHVGATQLLTLSGISVFTEGLLIQVPSGNFLVEPGCAGLNFFLTSLALSLVYGRLVYQTTLSRILCVAVALAVSVVANIVRIYLIIALTEWTNAKIDIAADHIVFGWGFFSVVMLALMWAGARLARPQPNTAAQTPRPASPAPLLAGAMPVVVVCCLALAAVAPALSAAVMNDDAATVPHLALPHNISSWHRAESAGSDWRPGMIPADATIAATYVGPDAPRIDIAAAVYAAQRQGHEAAAAGNRPEGEGWHATGTSRVAVSRGQGQGTIAMVHLRRGQEMRVTAFWYETRTCMSPSRVRAKLCTLRDRLGRHSTAGAFVAISADTAANPVETERALAAFAESLPPFVSAGAP